MDSMHLDRVGTAARCVTLALISLFSFQNTQAAAVGRTVGNFDVSPGGAAQYSVPLYTPPGTNELQPALALTYSSNNGPGHFGVGWSLTGLSSIYRCNSTWEQNSIARDVRNDMQDRFCLDGNQLRLTSGTYGAAGSTYQTEFETFSRVTAYSSAGNGPGYFVVRRKDGLDYTYGATDDSQILSLGQTTARTWAVNRISDRAGNAIVITYTEDPTNGSYRPNTIEYTRNENAGVPTGPYLVTFVPETIPVGEIDSQYVAGSNIRRITRIKQIDITHGSTLVRSHRLTYEPLSSTLRSRLASIEECAGATPECYPPSTFTYQNGAAGLNAEGATGISGASLWFLPWALDISGDGRKDLVYSSSTTPGAGVWMYALANSSGSYDAGVSTGVTNTNQSAASPIDYNNDGLEDLLIQNTGGTWWVMHGTASGLGAPVNTSAPVVGVQTRAIDINGDSLQDIVWRHAVGYAGGDAIKYRLRLAGGAFSTTESTLVGPMPVDTKISSAFPLNDVGPNHIPDFNGDSIDDISYITVQRVFNDGNGTWMYFTRLNVYCPGGPSFTTNINDSSQPYFGELNGDGRTDILYYVAGTSPQWRARYSTGTSFTAEIAGPSYSSTLYPFLLMDWDSDGLDDLLARNSADLLILYRSTGVSLATGVSTGITGAASWGNLTDINGDGLLDVTYKNASGALQVRTHAGVYPDLLLSATDGFGSAVTFNYGPLTTASYTRGSTAQFPEQDYQGPMNVVNNLVASNGIGGTYTQSFSYSEARFHRQGRGFEGFKSKRMQDSRNSIYTQEYYKWLFPYTGAIYQTDILQPNGSTLISQTVNTWTEHSFDSGARKFPYVSASTRTEREVDGPGTLFRTIATSITMDVWGTPTDVTTTTTENATGLSTGATHTQRVWHTAVTNDQANWCFSKPTSTSLINSHSLAGGTQITRVVDHVWDFVKCRMTQEVIEPSSTQWKVTSDLVHDTFGNVSSQTVTPVGQPARLTSVNWGTNGRFPLTITNPLSQVTTITWDAPLSALDTVSDPNNLTLNVDYDVFGRKVRELWPDGTATRWTLVACNSANSYCGWGDTLLRYRVQSDLRNVGDTATIHDSYISFDQFGRVKYPETRTLSGSVSASRVDYDSLGRVTQRLIPRILGSTDPTKYVTFTYDLLDRVKKEEREVSEANSLLQSTQWTYNGLSVIESDALSHNTTKYFTAAGQLAQVIDAAGNDTDYEYDAFGELLKTRDFYGNEITLGYNIRGFKTGLVDPDMGSWVYDYYPLGELKSQTDAKGQTVTFTVDKLSRPFTRVENEGTTTWTWGTSAANHDIGELASVSYSANGYSESYTYDGNGRPNQTSIVADGTTYLVNQAYSIDTGFLETLTYPTSTSGVRFKLKYTYNYGHLQKIHDYTGDVQTTKYWEAISTNARGMVIDEAFGNGLKTFSKYDHIAGWLDYRQSAPGGGSSTQYLDYDWDKVGNLTQRKDVNQSLTENFTYDALNRLYQTSGVSSLTMAYDPIGNITSKSDVGSYTYHATKKHAVTAAGANTYGYDANGNMSLRNGASTSWTSYNLPSLINQSGGNSSSFSYGANRARYKQVNVNGSTTETTIYIAGLLEKVIVGTATDYKHYVQGTTGIAAIHIRSTTGANSTYYPLKDHLGSTDRITNSAGSVVVALSYDSFGQRRGSTWTGSPSSGDWTNIAATTRHGFTEHEHLDNLALVHMNGRVYDPTIGRFTSSDPYVTEPFNTQGFNRYSYVLNNPLTLIDPSGFGPDRPVPPPGTPCLPCEPGERRPPAPPVPPTPPPRPGAPINAIPPNGVPGDFMPGAMGWAPGVVGAATCSVVVGTPGINPGSGSPCGAQSSATSGVTYGHRVVVAGRGVATGTFTSFFSIIAAVPDNNLFYDFGSTIYDDPELAEAFQDGYNTGYVLGVVGLIAGARASPKPATTREAARGATRLGPRSIGAAENARGVVSGNINKIKDGRLKDLGIDAEAVKKDVVGRAGGRFNLSVDDAGNVFLTPVRPGASQPVPTYMNLDELAASYPRGP